MSTTHSITRFDIRKIQIPIGRVIGDSMCHYEQFHATVLRLETKSGLVGWGFGEKAHGGHFAKQASWDQAIPAVAVLTQEFEKDLWPHFEGKTPTGVKLSGTPLEGDTTVRMAARMALWDLLGKEANLPVFRLLGGNKARTAIKSYASACEFHLPDDFLRSFYGEKVKQGFKAFKLKIGHSDIDHDLRRLRIMREVIGPDASLAADANKAWTAEQTVKNLAYFAAKGVPLTYIEDPMEPDNLDGYRYLKAHCPTPVVGHDYVAQAHKMRPLMETGALSMLRSREGLDYGIGLLPFAREFNKPIIVTNTLFEWGIHFALACPQVDRIEFADLGWNDLPKQPITIKDGCMSASETPGLGFEPKPDTLDAWTIEK